MSNPIQQTVKWGPKPVLGGPKPVLGGKIKKMRKKLKNGAQKREIEGKMRKNEKIDVEPPFGGVWRAINRL